jgi:hypothetical protein
MIRLCTGETRRTEAAEAVEAGGEGEGEAVVSATKLAEATGSDPSHTKKNEYCIV